jgi:hypothetical protein
MSQHHTNDSDVTQICETLVKSIMRAFYPDKLIVVMDALIREKYIIDTEVHILTLRLLCVSIIFHCAISSPEITHSSRDASVCLKKKCKKRSLDLSCVSILSKQRLVYLFTIVSKLNPSFNVYFIVGCNDARRDAKMLLHRLPSFLSHRHF